jgi:mannose/fructose/N-acetylgalactosamine-specific phosphotransferase system component IID
MGCGPFWPAWVIFGFVIATGFEAFRINHLTFLEEILPFLRPEWEEEQKKALAEHKAFLDPQSFEAKPKKQIKNLN